MAQPALGDVYRQRMFCYDTPLTQICINTVYFKVTDVTNVGTMLTPSMVGVMDTRMGALYKPTMPATAQYYGLSMQLVNGVGPPPVPINSNAVTGVGTAAGNITPLQVSGLVSFRTAFAGRHYRGRIYPGFVPVSSVDANGAMNNAGEGLIATFGAGFIGNITITSGANSIIGVFVVRTSVKNILPGGPPTITYNPITLVVTPQRFATQRRRGQFGRINALPF